MIKGIIFLTVDKQSYDTKVNMIFAVERTTLKKFSLEPGSEP